MATTIIAIFLGLSLAGNTLFFFYTRYLLDKVEFFASNIDELKQIVQKYMLHISTILEKHVYGEDPVLKRLLQHSGELVQDLNDFIHELDEVTLEVNTPDDNGTNSKEKKGSSTKGDSDSE